MTPMVVAACRRLARNLRKYRDKKKAISDAGWSDEACQKHRIGATERAVKNARAALDAALLEDAVCAPILSPKDLPIDFLLRGVLETIDIVKGFSSFFLRLTAPIQHPRRGLMREKSVVIVPETYRLRGLRHYLGKELELQFRGFVPINPIAGTGMYDWQVKIISHEAVEKTSKSKRGGKKKRKKKKRPA
jgi:hypothetical protein